MCDLIMKLYFYYDPFVNTWIYKELMHPDATEIKKNLFLDPVIIEL